MTTRTTPLTHFDAPRRRLPLLEVVTTIAVIAAIIAVGARATGRIPDRDAVTADRATRLVQMVGIWADTATNPRRTPSFRLLDPATGAPTGAALPLPLPEFTSLITFAADGRRVAYTDTSRQTGPFTTTVAEVETGRVVRQLSYDTDTFALQLSDDGARLVLYRLSAGQRPPFTLLTVDVASGATLNTVTLSTTGDGWPRLTPDLTTAYVLDTHTTGTYPNATSGTPTLELVALATGAQRTVPLPMLRAGTFPQERKIGGDPVPLGFSPGLAVSPDGARLFIAHAERDAITVVNLYTAFVERTETIAPRQTAAARLVGLLLPERVAAKFSDSTSKRAILSPDGATLVVTGTVTRTGDDGRTFDQTDLGVQFVALRTFTETARPLQRQYQGYPSDMKVQWSADGRRLYIGSITDDDRSGGNPTAYLLRVMDARTQQIIASRATVADTDTTAWMLANWFAFPAS